MIIFFLDIQSKDIYFEEIQSSIIYFPKNHDPPLGIEWEVPYGKLIMYLPGISIWNQVHF